MKKRNFCGWLKNLTIRRLVVLGLLLALVLGVFVWRWYKEAQETSCYQTLVKIQEETDKKVAQLNPYFSRFQADPKTSSLLSPKFKEAQKILRSSVRKLKKVNPPSSLKKLHQDLILLYTKSSSIYGDLASLSSYLSERDRLLRKLAESFKSFSQKITQAKSDAEVLEAAQEFKQEAINIKGELEKLKSPIYVYSNKLLIRYLDELTKALDLLEEGIEKKDVDKVREAVESLGKVFSYNWQKAVFEVDEKEIKRYDKRVEEVNRLREIVEQDKISYASGKE